MEKNMEHEMGDLCGVCHAGAYIITKMLLKSCKESRTIISVSAEDCSATAFWE